MKSASIQEIKATLKTRSQSELLELCLRLARFKKENKELLTFLLFEADDLQAYLDAVKKELDDELAAINTGSLHWVKKSMRRLLRMLNKHIRYTGSKTAEAELRIYFCSRLKQLPVSIFKSTALTNLYYSQLKKAEAALKGMHEDLQRDYQVQLDALKQR
jgi:hypothetical protein